MRRERAGIRSFVRRNVGHNFHGRRRHLSLSGKHLGKLMQHWLNWGRKEHMFQYPFGAIVLDFMGFPDNRCHGWKLWMSKLCSELRLTVTCHMCSEQWGKILVGIDEPYWGPSGKRRQEVGWGKDAPCLRVRRPTRRTSTPRRRGDAVGRSSERRGLIQGMTPFLTPTGRLSSINFMYYDGSPFHNKDKFDVVKVTIEEDWTRQLLEEQWSALFPIPSFKLLLNRHFGVKWHE